MLAAAAAHEFGRPVVERVATVAITESRFAPNAIGTTAIGVVQD